MEYIFNDALYAFYHAGWYSEYGKTFSCRLTADSRLHAAVDVDLWSNPVV